MTPMPGVVPTQVNHQAIAPSKLEQYIELKAEENNRVSTEDYAAPTLADVTKTIVHYAFWLAEQKQKLPLQEYKKLLAELGWQGEEKRYLKIAAAFGKFSPEDFAQVEPRTIYQLGENSKKYQQVIERLLDLREITQETIRTLTKKARHPQGKRPEKPSIWRRTKNGGRYCQIPPIHEAAEQTGVTLQRMMDEEGLSAQYIVADAIALRQAYQEGRLVRVEETKCPPGK
ncbi:hypothetical protein [Cylindrospermum sp. FACHB-282]|uniref:hypothetical protein n=1 Tax=Cylindrospermum sp. FACHB-282 TaxID=2692794 RepID=UPI001684350B|nr:hypothetical protein [Cylindrospermum sp. FACHB-282]MBD2387040.1 hypothetical protein [Cylindrospermum sp. FACHB-282]